MLLMIPQLPAHRHASRIEGDRLISLINSMADAVIAIDKHNKIVVYNGAALNILDLNSSMHGLTLDKVLNPIDKNNQSIDIIEYIRNLKIPTTTESWRLKFQDGSTINLFLSISPVAASYGTHRQSGFVLVLRDITRAKSLEEERNEFISVVSHELRTPIAIAEGNISNAQFIVSQQSHSKDVAKALQDAHDQILFLADMINDLATLSRAERGKLTVDVAPINAYDLVHDLASGYASQAKKKGISIDVEIDPKLELLQSSVLYVREILQNFLTNALKYTEKGTVRISVKPRPGGIIFEVSDTGIGISHADQEKIFDKFFRSEDYRTRQTKGTGLGLYVTMKLARLIHANISVESQLNHGSTFIIFVPNLR